MGDSQYTPLVDDLEPIKTYSLFTGFALCINLIVGTGVFNLPFAFYNSGLVLAVVLLIISGFFSWMCLVWVLEICARAEGITAQKEHNLEQPIHCISMRKFDFNELCHFFYGFKGKLGCQLFLSLYCYGLLWAYAAVFSDSVNNLFWQFYRKIECSLVDTHDCHIGYYVCLVVYACIVVPVSLLNVTEQAVVQVMLTCYRFVAFGVMVVTVSVALAYPVNPNDFVNNTLQNVTADKNVWVNWSGFAGIFTTAAVALNFHFTIPDLVRPVEKKKFLPHMTTAALIVASSFYILVGILCSRFFKSNTESLATLNWQTYTGLEGGWGGDLNARPWWAVVVQFIVMLFPIFDMLSVFPLVAVTLGENLCQMFPGGNIFAVIRPGKPFSRSVERDIRISHTVCRLFSSVPPIILAFALKGLSDIFDFTGLFAFFLQLIVPCLLQLKSRSICENTWGPSSWKTIYTNFISANGFVYSALVFGIGALIFALLDFIAVKVNPNFWG
eukprot:TRINITY_DN27910_c0_g1_i1.p1 TRINITY_DN27910_c0_g1~~TRINITY_DN27910_c0_g1_i1.p1  ORF type:complete len:509 (+),score=33.35 TRINITY_DN27910_c0_g1_i1:36-1529(+)